MINDPKKIKHLDKMRKKQKFQGCGCKLCKQNQYYLKMGRFDIPEKIDGFGWGKYNGSTFFGKEKTSLMRGSLGKSWGNDIEGVRELGRQENVTHKIDGKLEHKRIADKIKIR